MFRDASPRAIHAAHLALTGQPPAGHHTCARLIHDLARTYGPLALGLALTRADTPAPATVCGAALA